MRPLLTVIMLILALNCFGQSPYDKTRISKQTEQIVAKIEKVNELMGRAVSYEGMRPTQYDNFIELQKTATQSELIALTNHSNGVVRCYAFWALSYDTSANLLPILVNHLNDTALVETQFGCFVGRKKVGDFFINMVTPPYKLTPDEYDYLDSILIYTPNNLPAKANAINRAKLNETLYARIRELVVQENNHAALVTLAKFKREQDIPLILNNKQQGENYRAISEFPDQAFLPLLKKSMYEALDKGAWSSEWSELYKAIASFKNDTALQLLKIPFTQTKYENIRQYHINFIFEAVQEFYTPMYNELLWTLWENEKMINNEVFNLLYPTNPEKAFQLTKTTIQDTDSYFNYEEISANLLDVMLDTILVRDRRYAIALINQNIRETNVHQFPTFADKALAIKDTSFVSALFDRLEKEWNPHIYLKATEILIAFKDPAINRRLADISKSNPNKKENWDWGAREFIKLLKENGIK